MILTRGNLHETYKNEKIYWSKKCRIQWLKRGDKNSKFFHTYTAQRRKSNSIERLTKERGGFCEIEEEITQYYSKLFTTASPQGWQNILQGMPQTITSTKNQLLKTCGGQ